MGRPWEESPTVVELDGAFGEGGGQILRTALSLSALSGESVRIRRIRAGRRKPGLSPQHLMAVRATGQLCRAELVGDELRSTDLTFRPKDRPQAGEYSFDIADASKGGSAGSVTLLAQALILPLCASEGSSTLHLHGGTHVRWSPPFTYFQQVYLPALEILGFHVESELEAWGFYPAGGGEIELRVSGLQGDRVPTAENGVRWTERGELQRIGGEAVASNLPSHIPQRMTDRARSYLSDLGVSFKVIPRRVRGRGPGAGLFLIGEYQPLNSGFAGHGEKGKPSEAVAEEACRAFLAHHQAGAPVDEHLADQLLLPLALTAGRSVFVTSAVTDHLKTNAHVIRQFLPVQVAFQPTRDDLWRIEVTGVDHREVAA